MTTAPLQNDVTVQATMFDPELTYYRDGTAVAVRWAGGEQLGTTAGMTTDRRPYPFQVVRYQDGSTVNAAPHVVHKLAGPGPVPALEPDEITSLRGVFAEGYTPDDVNRVFGLVQHHYAVTLVCRWETLDEGWYRGNSEFYFAVDGTYHYDAGVYAWLSGHPGAPAHLGHPNHWRGSPVPQTDPEGPAHAVTDDGFHNLALVDHNR